MSERDDVEAVSQGGESPPRGRARPASSAAPSPKPRTGDSVYRPPPYPYEIRRRAVQLHQEEGYSAGQVARELGVSDGTVCEWSKRYLKYGEAGLKPGVGKPPSSKLPGPVKDKITELKREDPRQGGKRISQILRRLFFLKASPEAVRRHLKAVDLAAGKAPARKKPKPPPRRFERSTPNEMWQSGRRAPVRRAPPYTRPSSLG